MIWVELVARFRTIIIIFLLLTGLMPVVSMVIDNLRCKNISAR